MRLAHPDTKIPFDWIEHEGFSLLMAAVKALSSLIASALVAEVALHVYCFLKSLTLISDDCGCHKVPAPRVFTAAAA